MSTERETMKRTVIIDASNRFGKKVAEQVPAASGEGSGVSPITPMAGNVEVFEYRLVNLLVAAAELSDKGKKREAKELITEAMKVNLASWVMLPDRLGAFVEQADLASAVFGYDDEEDC